MNLKSRYTLFFSLFFLFFIPYGFGQTDPYRAEMGFQTGVNLYAGDVNTIADLRSFVRNTQNLSLDYGVTFRYRVNKRIAFRAGYDFTGVDGVYKYIDGEGDYSTSLKNSIHLFDLWSEFNFYDLENNPYRPFSKKYSPYIFAGLGMMYSPHYSFAPIENQNKHSFSIPFGVGFKWKFAPRLNLNARLTSRLMMNDGLEAISDFDAREPFNTNNFMNYDLLSGFTIGITYDFWMKDCGCVENSFSKGKKPYEQKLPKAKKESKEKKNRKSRL